MYNDYFSIKEFKGKVFNKVERVEENSADAIVFTTEDATYKMYHEQSCCENVYIESINGDLADLVGNPILMAEEVTETCETDDHDSYTWTFYKIGTIKGTVTIRWNGVSNGYYSESVEIRKEN